MIKILQVLNKILKDKDVSIILKNNLTSEHFVGYEKEFNYIMEHYKQYNNVPDVETFICEFPEFKLIDVNETDIFLVNQLIEEKCYVDLLKTLTTSKTHLESNAITAYEFLQTTLKEIRPVVATGCKDIMATAMDRYVEYLDRENMVLSGKVITTGFPELDEILFGWEAGEELVTVLARTNQGKSWLGIKFMVGAWLQGKSVLHYSGEMSHSQIGYRIDSTIQHLSNKDLIRGNKSCAEKYLQYIKDVKEKGIPYNVVTQDDLGGKLTVGKLRSLIELYKPDIICIDQYSLMEDDRAKPGDQPRTKLSHISEDLFLVSTEYKIPIIALAQANRAGVKDQDDDSPPGLEHIKESDDIAHNSSRVISIRRSGENDLIMEIIKNRYGRVGDKFYYHWDIDTGYYSYVKTIQAGQNVQQIQSSGNDKKYNKDNSSKQKYSSSEVPF